MKAQLSGKSNRGFSTLEILIAFVILILCIGAVIMIVFGNQSVAVGTETNNEAIYKAQKEFKKANDTQRSSNVNAILNALGQNIVDGKGTISCTGITTVDPVPNPLLATIGTNISDVAGDVNLRNCLVSTYIPELPVDPIGGQAFDSTKAVGLQYNIKYRVFVDSNGRYTIFAPNTELASPIIQVTR